MKLTLQPEDLKAAAAWAARALPSRPHLPVLAGLVLDAGDGAVSLAAFDYSTSARAQVPAQVDAPGRVILPGRVFTEIVKTLPAGQPMTLALAGTRAVIVCGRAEFALQTLPEEDYPTLPAIPPEVGRVEAEQLHRAIAQTAIAAARDDTLPALTGLRIELGAEQISLAATDRYRMAVRTLPWQATGDSEHQLLAPARTLLDLTKDISGEATIAADDHMLAITAGGRTITVRLLEDRFPEWRRIIEGAGGPITAHLPAEDVLGAVNRVALVAERDTPVRLAFDCGRLTVSADSGDGRGAETFDVKHDGKITIAFRSRFLADALTSAKASTVTLHMSEQDKPALITPAGDHSTYRHLIMPIRLA